MFKYEECGDFQFRGGNSTEDEIYLLDSCLSNTMRNGVYLSWLIVFILQSMVIAYYISQELKGNRRGLRFYLLVFLFADDMAYIIKEIALLTHANLIFNAIMALLSYWMCELAIATLLHKWLKASLDILNFRQPNERVVFQRFIRSFIVTFSILFGLVSTVLWFIGYIVLEATGNKATYNLFISIGFVWFGVCVYVLALWFIYVIRKLFSVIEEDSGDLINASFSRDSLKFKLLFYTSFEVIILVSAGTACFTIVALASIFKAAASPFYFFLFEIGFNVSGVLVISSIFWILLKGSSGGSSFNSSSAARKSSSHDPKFQQKDIEIIDFSKPKPVSPRGDKEVDDKLDIFLQSVNHSDGI